MKARSIKANSVKQLQQVLAGVISNDFSPTMVVLFLSVQQDRQAVVDLFNQYKIDVFGATTSGEFIDGETGNGSIVALLLEINSEFYKLKFLETGEKSTKENAVEIGRLGKELFANPAFIIVSGWLTQDGEAIVEGITNGAGGEVVIFGGMAGDDLKLEGPLVFNNTQKSDKGLLAFILDADKIEINGIATCGWKAIGTNKTITKSEDNVVYTIDDKPALDTIMKYLGVEINFDQAKEIVTQIGAYYPLQMERENVAPVMRTAMFANLQDRSLICAGNVPQGSRVKFSLPPDFDAIEIVVEECKALKKNKQPEADALIMFSCISRNLSFGILISEEIDQVKEVWDAPMVGFFSYGEFGKSHTGKHEFHNNTCCLVALKEKVG
ncbi:hypothetical protein C7S20_08985 [Christiangramia fulva]|uniref:Histidine kinase n=1 Tax=Christiangramia fulva TaxID=2126553 RepID=A0A2R3Z596_9FLAO|nr:FIST N-terminal domain-containing protein [Christiangramia fulva]AVR45394.1 hypothetical protein C7S20_08985 [Christiangramia fulva]